MSRPSARESIALMAGYHSPQIEGDVRRNTNESPEPPPEGCADSNFYHDAILEVLSTETFSLLSMECTHSKNIKLWVI